MIVGIVALQPTPITEQSKIETKVNESEQQLNIQKTEEIKLATAQKDETTKPDESDVPKTLKKEIPKVTATGSCVEAMKQVFPEHLWNGAMIVLQHENGSLNPNATHKNKNGSVDYGCFQINNEPAALNPIVSAQRAYQKYLHPRKVSNNGWNHWYAVKGILWN